MQRDTTRLSLKHGDVYISNFYSEDDLAYAVAELTDAYNNDEGVESFLRGVRLDRKSGYVTIQDEIKLNGTNDMYWFAHTDADIDISADGKSATLTKNGKKIKAFIVNGDSATFSVMDAKPMATSPQVPDQDAIPENVKKLTIHIDECSGIDLCVVLATSGLSIDSYEYSSISEWLHEGDTTKQTVIKPEPVAQEGCSASIGFGALASVASLAFAGAVVVSKKRK